MAYPSRYYAMQHTVMLQIRWSRSTGLCPICKTRPSGIWPDGTRRITCGTDACFRYWLPGQSYTSNDNNALPPQEPES